MDGRASAVRDLIRIARKVSLGLRTQDDRNPDRLGSAWSPCGPWMKQLYAAIRVELHYSADAPLSSSLHGMQDALERLLAPVGEPFDEEIFDLDAEAGAEGRTLAWVPYSTSRENPKDFARCLKVFDRAVGSVEDAWKTLVVSRPASGPNDSPPFGNTALKPNSSGRVMKLTPAEDAALTYYHAAVNKMGKDEYYVGREITWPTVYEYCKDHLFDDEDDKKLRDAYEFGQKWKDTPEAFRQAYFRARRRLEAEGATLNAASPKSDPS